MEGRGVVNFGGVGHEELSEGFFGLTGIREREYSGGFWK